MTREHRLGHRLVAAIVGGPTNPFGAAGGLVLGAKRSIASAGRTSSSFKDTDLRHPVYWFWFAHLFHLSACSQLLHRGAPLTITNPNARLIQRWRGSAYRAAVAVPVSSVRQQFVISGIAALSGSRSPLCCLIFVWFY